MTFKPRINWVHWTWVGWTCIAAGVAALCCALTLFAWDQAESLVKRRVLQAAAELGRKLGTPVLVGKVEITPFPLQVAVEDIRVGLEAQVVISRIEADVALKPFRRPFFEFDEVSIDRFALTMTEDNLRKVVVPDGLGQDSAESAPMSLERAITKIFSSLPSRHLTVYGAQMTVLNAQGAPIVKINDLRLTVDKSTNEVDFRIAQLKTLSGFNESYLYGRLELSSSAPDYRFFVKSQVSPSAKARIWSSSGLVRKDLNQVQLNLAFHRRPTFLANLLKGQPLAVTRLRSRLQIELTRALGDWQYTAQIQSLGSTVRLPLVSARELGPLFFEFRASGSIQPTSRTLVVDAATLTLPSRLTRAFGDDPLRFAARFHASVSNDVVPHLAMHGQITLPTTSCKTLVEASPDGLLPLVEGFKLSGDAAATLEFDFQTENLVSSRFALQDAVFGCNVREAPYAFTASHLNGPLAVERQVEPDTPPLTIHLDKLAPSFAATSMIAKNAQVAFVSAEDAAFYRHKGIDAAALVSALRRDLAEGRIAAGGSTITMQTVKNLFLTPERSLSRKMQELFLAWHLNRTLSKERILELYMNVAELGPGIFGIAQASEHFFGKPAADLTLLESAYLATLLPSPKIRYRYFCKGELTPKYRELVHDLLRRMQSLGRISNDRYQQALNSGLHFNVGQRSVAKDCSPLAHDTGDKGAARPESAYLMRRSARAAVSE